MTEFLPAPRLALRLAIFGALAAFGLIGTAAWFSKIMWLGGMAFLFGSFRIARFADDHFERRLVLMFFPLPWKRWPRERFIEIETRYSEESGIAALPLPLLGFTLWLWSAVFDWTIPWLGGNYKLRLRMAKGGRVLVWQGNSDANFEANLARLQSVTGLPLRRV